MQDTKRNISAFSLGALPLLPNIVRRHFAKNELRARSELDFNRRKYYLQFAYPPAFSGRTRIASSSLGPIWQYWNNGYDRAPRIIQRCLDSVEIFSGSRKRVIVTDDTIHKYVELPKAILDKKDIMGATHFSDILRVFLLKDHGGTWIDASVFLTGSIEDFTNSPYFAFSRPNDPYLLSSWFMHSCKSHVIPATLSRVLERYWSQEGDLRDYFAIHFVFEAALSLNREFRNEWLRSPLKWADDPHWLQVNIDSNLTVEQLKNAVGKTPIHKLTYKLDAGQVNRLINYLDIIQEMDN